MVKIEELKRDYLDYFRDVPVQKYAAEYIGRDEDTIIRWKRADKQFADAVQRAHSEWVRKTFIKTKAEFALERLEKLIFTPQPEPALPPQYNVSILDARGKHLSDSYTAFIEEITKQETPPEVLANARQVPIEVVRQY